MVTFIAGSPFIVINPAEGLEFGLTFEARVLCAATPRFRFPRPSLPADGVTERPCTRSAWTVIGGLAALFSC
jgi:hypothetical protein